MSEHLADLKAKVDSAQREYQYALLRDAVEAVIDDWVAAVKRNTDKYQRLSDIYDGWNPDTGG